MDEIEDYVGRMFTGLPKTKSVMDMKQNILENMQEHYEDLLSQGKSGNEALGTVISQFGNIEEIKNELGIKDSVEDQRQNGILETIFSYFLPAVLFWRILIHRSPLRAAVFFSAAAVYLLSGFTLKLWNPGWIVFLLAGLVILLIDRKESVKINYSAEVRSHYGILETIFAYFLPAVLFWRILIRRNITEAVIFFSAFAVHLLLGFALNLWSVSWIVFLLAGLVILLINRHEESCRYSG